MTILPGVDAEVVTRVDSRAKPMPDLFLIVAFYAPGDYWDIPNAARGPWTVEANAVEAAAQLAACWTAYRIVRVPGEKP